MAPIYGIFSAKMDVFCQKWLEKVFEFFLNFFQIGHFRRIFAHNVDSRCQIISLIKCKTSLFSANFNFCTVSKKQKVMKTRKFHILDYFWRRESTFWAKIRRKWSIWKLSRKTFFGHFRQKRIFSLILPKILKYAINRHPKVVESPNFFWRSSKHLSKSCKKIKSLLASCPKWQPFKSLYSFFWDTLYNL